MFNDKRSFWQVDASDFPLLIAHGQGDDNFLDASSSSLPVILFGDGGNDELHGGSSKDILLGDYREVIWYKEDSKVVARVGGGRYGDLTDGKVMQIN